MFKFNDCYEYTVTIISSAVMTPLNEWAATSSYKASQVMILPDDFSKACLMKAFHRLSLLTNYTAYDLIVDMTTNYIFVDTVKESALYPLATLEKVVNA